MARVLDEIMASSGPEDGLTATQTNINSSPFYTAGPDWLVYRVPVDPARLHYKDEQESNRFFAQAASSGPSGIILRELMTRRDLCAKQVYMHQVSSGRADACEAWIV
jgi:hypothetical protein